MVAQHRKEKAKGDYKDLKWFLSVYLINLHGMKENINQTGFESFQTKKKILNHKSYITRLHPQT